MDYLSIDGYEEIDDVLKNVENFENAFIEMNMCKGGCINGPAKLSTKNVMLDNIIVKRYAKNKGEEVKIDIDINTTKNFTPLTKNFKVPSEEEMIATPCSVAKFLIVAEGLVLKPKTKQLAPFSINSFK